MRIIKSLFGVLTVVSIGSLTACNKSDSGDIVERSTAVSSKSPETQSDEYSYRADVEKTLKRDWKSVEFLDQTETAHPGRAGLIDYKVRFRVKGKKEGPSSSISPANPSAATKPPLNADSSKSVTSDSKDNTLAPSSKPVEALGLLGPQARNLSETNLDLAKIEEFLRKVPNLRALGAEVDLRILDNSQNRAPIVGGSKIEDSYSWPIAYVLFEKDNLTNGVKLTAKMLDSQVGLALHKSFNASLSADPEILDSDKSSEPRVIFASERKSFVDCKAVGWAVFGNCGDTSSEPDAINSPYGQGIRFWAIPTSADYILIEEGSDLNKWIASAHYLTNAFSSKL